MFKGDKKLNALERIQEIQKILTVKKFLRPGKKKQFKNYVCRSQNNPTRHNKVNNTVPTMHKVTDDEKVSKRLKVIIKIEK